ncbi:hypothetical protein JOC78_001393 [Bacillus ectoiniformans]|uniref:Ig-like domain-containing protein n=1 Tax=Bacillus ectoiniformans TaxID=1494429 RepID=UPI00195A2E16|nr:Ig-like domain-containing protein [Bacillus ectoiniformans]MBM7648451.1 hypothetical protein [Bacillus ectoiniformans]
MYRKVTPVVAAVFATGMMLSAPAYAAPKEDHKPVNSVKEKKEAKEKEKGQNKGQTQQLKSVDKKLDKIEEFLIAYKAKLASMEEKEETEKDTDVPEEENQTPEEQEQELPAEGTDEEPVNDDETTEEQTPQEPADEENAGVEEPADHATAQSEDVIVDEDLTDTEIEEEVEEVENEVKAFPGYAGKFHALENRLNAVTNQLNALSRKGADSAALKERYDRIATLKAEITAIVAQIKGIQENVNEEIEKDESVLEKAPVEDVATTKEWTIKFNQRLDEKTLSELDIIILDEEKNLVETTFSYSSKTKSITVSALQPYEAGSTYTLYIGKKISGLNGKDLKNSVKMNFSVGD